MLCPHFGAAMGLQGASPRCRVAAGFLVESWPAGNAGPATMEGQSEALQASLLIKGKSGDSLEKCQQIRRCLQSEIGQRSIWGTSKFHINLRQGGGKEGWTLSLASWKGCASLKFGGADWVEMEASSGIWAHWRGCRGSSLTHSCIHACIQYIPPGTY